MALQKRHGLGGVVDAAAALVFASCFFSGAVAAALLWALHAARALSKPALVALLAVYVCQLVLWKPQRGSGVPAVRQAFLYGPLPDAVVRYVNVRWPASTSIVPAFCFSASARSGCSRCGSLHLL